MILFVLLLYLANNFLLEPLYTKSAKSSITDLYDEVNDMKVSEYTSENLYNMLIDNGLFVDFVITDTENNTIYVPENPLLTNDRDRPAGNRSINEPPKNLITVIEEEFLSDNNKFVRYDDNISNKQFIMFNGVLDNGMDVNIRLSIDSVSRNVSFLNQFIIGAGVIIFLFSLIAANVISEHFTTPILNIFNTTDRIKKMDFSSTCEVTTNDELGRLAENINEMTYILKDNIENLATSNSQLTEEINERLKIDEQRKALLNNVSHELKTPLSLVQGYSEGLKLNLHKNTDRADFYCDVIIDEAKKMDMLVSQLLDINRLQFGDFPLHKEETDAVDFITYIINKYTPIFKESNLTYTDNLEELRSREESVMLNIDALRSEQILTNLLNNAIAYADKDKNINLSATITPDDDKQTSKDHNHLRITFSNSYSEVEDNELEEWWNSFYKVDKARTRENGGYGLGLSIVKAIQEADSNHYGVYYDSGTINFYVDFDIVG